jgi:hypothetical protein
VALEDDLGVVSLLAAAGAVCGMGVCDIVWCHVTSCRVVFCVQPACLAAPAPHCHPQPCSIMQYAWSCMQYFDAFRTRVHVAEVW